MKIQIGNIISQECGGRKQFALYVDGLGILKADIDFEDPPFQCVILSKAQKKKLFRMLEKEFKHEK